MLVWKRPPHESDVVVLGISRLTASLLRLRLLKTMQRGSEIVLVWDPLSASDQALGAGFKSWSV